MERIRIFMVPNNKKQSVEENFHDKRNIKSVSTDQLPRNMYSGLKKKSKKLNQKSSAFNSSSVFGINVSH